MTIRSQSRRVRLVEIEVNGAFFGEADECRNRLR